jgi:hypothetical protein
MKVNRDFRDLFAEFNAHGVEYLIVGAHALAAHGVVRATKDLDVWVRPTEDNATAVLRALGAFGAPLHDLEPRDLATPGMVFQIGVEPVRIDIITTIDGVLFSEAWGERVESHYGDQGVYLLSRSHLIQNKSASGRLQDLADIERLRQIEPAPAD